MAKKRKTKKDKIIADLKKELAKKRPAAPNPPAGLPRGKAGGPKLLKLSPTFTNVDNQINLHFKKDLTKSLVLAILVIGFELVVYWQLR